MTASDFKYLGAYRINGDAYGYGLALRYEPSDTINPVHLLATGYAPGGVGTGSPLIEWRDIKPEIPANPTTAGSYSTAHTVKNYGNIYGSHPSKRLGACAPAGVGYCPPSGRYDFNDGQAGTLRTGSLFWDPLDNRLYWTYGETYDSGGDPVFFFGYSDLDYRNAIATGHGPWGFERGLKWKSGAAGILGIPDAFVTANGLGNRRLGFVGSPEASIVGNGDFSAGPALTAVAPPSPDAEQTRLPFTRLIGFTPFAAAPSKELTRATRAAEYTYTPAPARPADSWPGDKWSYADYTAGGVWIHGASKSGFVTVNKLALGLFNYVNSGLKAERWYDSLSIVSESAMAEVVAGRKKPYEIQPVTYPVQIGAINYTPFINKTFASIASVTAMKSESLAEGAIVTTATPHGMSAGAFVAVSGTNRPKEYDRIWLGEVIDATHIRIKDPNLTGEKWAGSTATGGSLKSTQAGSWPNDPTSSVVFGGIRVRGLAFDPRTDKLYMLFVHPDNVVMVAVWLVDSN